MFNDIFPTNISQIDLSYDTGDTIEEYTVEFQVQYWTAGSGQVSGGATDQLVFHQLINRYSNRSPYLNNAKLFGFSIEDNDQKPPSVQSPVPQSNEDGVDHYLTSGFFGSYVDIEGVFRTEFDLIKRYREMSSAS